MIPNKKYFLVTTRPDVIACLAYNGTTPIPVDGFTNLTARLVVVDDETKRLKALEPFKRLLPRECKDFTDFIIFQDENGLYDAIDISSVRQGCTQEDITELTGLNDLFWF